jgi:hypothetical protein
MANPKTAKPATARHGEPVSKSEQLGGRLDFSNTPQGDEPQVPDNTGEDDETYFRARPHLRHGIRLAFKDEFPCELLKEARGGSAVVIVAVARDTAGNPTMQVRSIVFSKGGNA